MPRFYPFTWLLAGLLVGSAPAWAQQAPAPLISGDFRNLRFEEFEQPRPARPTRCSFLRKAASWYAACPAG
ncbi:MAG: hypothetical protein EOO59_15120 [Hymenobacter sp.]|nr:MAG: hypothetical protein EOO59_15120 [Hymenobacter sp.]